MTSIEKTAFEYQPTEDVTPEGSAITVNPASKVTLKTDSKLTAGTPGGSIVLSIQDGGNEFESTEPGDYTLGGEGEIASGLTVTNVTKGQTATLTISGTPAKAGQLTVTVAAKAFKYKPEKESTVTVTVDPPTVTAVASGTLTAGVEGDIKVKLTGSVFNSSINKDSFTLGGVAAEGLNVTSVTGGDSDEATLKVTPSQQGQITVAVKKEALKYQPESETIDAGSVTVSAPTGSVTGTLSGTLTAGTAASGAKIVLTATGDLNFKNPPDGGTITLQNASGLSIDKIEVTGNGKTATLTLSGTPEVSGAFSVNVAAGAFVAAPGSGAPFAVSDPTITVGYPKVSVSPSPDHLVEDDDTVKTITLTAKGSVFAGATGGTTNFSFEGYPDITLQSVTAAEGGSEAVLTFFGIPENSGTLTIKVQPGAFKYKPESEVSATVSITLPTGDLSARLNGELYAGTTVTTQTITLSIANSKGLHFKDMGLAAADFELLNAPAGLTIGTVTRVSATEATLSLTGTPAAAGTFQVQAKMTAFKAAPAKDMTAAGDITVGAANIKLALSDNKLQAGKADMTFTVTPSGGKLIDLANRAAAIDTGADLKDLTLGDMTQNADGSVTVAIKGMPPIAGSITITFQASMFEPRPEGPVSLTVPVAEGEQAAEPETEAGAPGINFGTPMDTLAGAVLSAEEKALYDKGAQVLIELVESDMGSQVPAGDKTAVEQAASGYTVGKYLDVSLYKTINGGPQTSVSETSAPIRVVFTIPEDLRAAGRQFAVVRVHEGKAELLKTVASSASTITVESDLFSTYAIVYRAAPATATPGPTAEPGSTVPATGDGTALLGWTALLLGCGAALVPAVFALRRKDRRG